MGTTPRFSALALIAALAWISSPAGAQDAAPGASLTEADLSGNWYVLVHYKDARSEDKSITKFKDFAWSVEQTANTLTWENYPYVVFSDAVELLRRHAMREHEPWEPDESTWELVKTSLDVSSRAQTRKRLKGSVEKGFKSLPPLGTGGFNTMTFTRNWVVDFKPQAINITIIDSLGSTGALEGMEDSILYEITERVGPGEFRGTYAETNKSGTFRMVRSAERKVVK
jgi:hypothetical protein